MKTRRAIGYFQNKSLREVGQSLGLSEDSAQKRVSRATEQLRHFLSKRGLTVGTSGLAVALAANAVQAAPAGLALVISSAAVVSTAAVQQATALGVMKAIAMTTLQKILIGGVIAAAVGTGIYEAHRASRLQFRNLELQQQLAPLNQQLRQLLQAQQDATHKLEQARPTAMAPPLTSRPRWIR